MDEGCEEINQDSLKISSESDYSRKDKSLRHLCSKFLEHYSTCSEINIDEAAAQLGVVRRRMYDIINVFEGIEVVARISRGRYAWHGFDKFKDSVKRENSCSDTSSSEFEANTKPNIFYADQLRPLPEDKSRDAVICGKSLGMFASLTQELVRLFLSSHNGIVCLDSAAFQLKTKMRRLYDVANILSSLNLIMKISSADGVRKPTFKWIFNPESSESISFSSLNKGEILGTKPPPRKRPHDDSCRPPRKYHRSPKQTSDAKPPSGTLEELATIAQQFFSTIEQKPTSSQKPSSDIEQVAPISISSKGSSIQSLLSHFQNRHRIYDEDKPYTSCSMLLELSEAGATLDSCSHQQFALADIQS